MRKTPVKSSSPILYCHCAYAKAVAPEVKQEVLAAIGRIRAWPFEAVADLCQLSAARIRRF